MKNNTKPPQSAATKPKTIREEAAKQLKDSELAAKEVADLCAQALEKARRSHVPHAGVGDTQPSGT